MLVAATALLSSHSIAQDAAPQSSLIVVPGDYGDQQNNDGGINFIGFGLLVIIAIGFPAIVSFGIRLYSKNNLMAYFGTYCIILAAYFSANAIVDDMPEGDIFTIGLMLLLVSMLGSLVAQTVYWLRLPKNKIK